MNSSTFLFLATVLISVISFSDGADKTCKSVVSDLTKRQMGGLSTCGKSMTFKNGKDKAAKTNCVLKCVMIKEGLLGPDGRITDESFNKFLEKEVPTPELMALFRPPFENCKKTTASALDPDGDEFCKSYDPFIKCLLGVIGSVCK